MRCQKARKFISLAMDERLTPARHEKLDAHLHSCSPCREWREEQTWLGRLIAAPPAVDPGPGLREAVMARIAKASPRKGLIVFPTLSLTPALLRAAALLVFVFSALFGLVLGAHLEDRAMANGAAAFSQALNLEAFADLPDDSFGAVYERLLQGEIQ